MKPSQPEIDVEVGHSLYTTVFQKMLEEHRLGGKTFVAAGVPTVAVGLLSPQHGFPLMFAALMLVAVVPLVYSYVAWHRERRAP